MSDLFRVLFWRPGSFRWGLGDSGESCVLSKFQSGNDCEMQIHASSAVPRKRRIEPALLCSNQHIKTHSFSICNPMHSAIMTRISILQLLFCAATFLTQSTVAEDAGAIDTRICFSSLITADANNDRELNKTEYITFLKIYGLPDMQVDKYVDLPLVLQSTFTLLSCICRSNGSSGSSCCVGPEAYIPTDGAADFEMPTPDQVTYLYRLCKVTDNAVDQATPTEDPTLSSSPTMASASPTLLPSGQPSVSPSEIPSVEPTISSANPSASLVPTLSPSNPQTTVGSESPTFENMVDAVIRTTYSISIVNGKRDAIKPASYIPDLIKAMDTVATEVAVLVEGDLGGNDMNRRKLAVTVELPTSITLIADQEWSDKGSTSVGKDMNVHLYQ
jgi:hypothetical protein